VPSSNGGYHDTFRCHPNYHPYTYIDRPWYDWAIVKWSTTRGGTGQNAAKILLWGTFSNDSDNSEPANYAAVQGLNKMNPTKDKTLRFGYLDELENTVRVISEKSDFVSVAFVVLPTVKSGTTSFPKSLMDSAKWYLVMPPRSDWQKLG
jgi:hypothetical protein